MAKQFTGAILTLIVKTYYSHPYSLLISHNTKARFELLRLSTTQTTRKYCNNVTLNDNECDSKKVDKQCTKLYKDEASSPVNVISNILSINNNNALKIYNSFCEINLLSNDEIINIIDIANKAGVSASMIYNNVPILIQNMATLERKLYCMKHLNNNVNNMFPLLNINLKYLHILIIDDIRTEHNNGIDKLKYLADTLECDIYNLCKLLVEEPSIIALSFNRIKTVINILKEYNYEKNDILNNLWLFKYSPRTIRRRSSSVKSAGVKTVKSWIIRCSVNGLQRYITRLKKEANLNTVYGSHISLLSAKLNISEEEVEFYIKRCPSILEVQLDKVNDVLDILLQYGYNAEDILMCQRVFLLKTSLLKERLRRLQQIRGPHRLSLVYCSSKIFENAVAFANSIYNRNKTETYDIELKK